MFDYLLLISIRSIWSGCSSRCRPVSPSRRSICRASPPRRIAARINRRLKMSKDRTDRESVLVELRRERGLTAGGDYRLGLVALNRLILQSGLTIGFTRLVVFVAIGSVVAFARHVGVPPAFVEAAVAALFSATRAAVSWCCSVLRSPAAEQIRRAIPRRARHHRAQPARRPSGADRHQHGRPRNARPDRQRVRHRHRRDHLRRRSRNGDAQSLCPHRLRRPAAVRHRGRHPGLDRRQPRRNPGKPVRRHPPALQDAAQDPRARRRRPRLGDDPLGAADRHVLRHPVASCRISTARCGTCR